MVMRREKIVDIGGIRQRENGRVVLQKRIGLLQCQDFRMRPAGFTVCFDRQDAARSIDDRGPDGRVRKGQSLVCPGFVDGQRHGIGPCHPLYHSK